MVKRYIRYEELWTKKLETFDRNQLSNALKYFFNVESSKNTSKGEIISKIEEEKAKREKVFSLVIDVDTENGKTRIPVPFWYETKEGEIELEQSTYLSKIDAFTIDFDDKKDLLDFLIAKSNILFDDETAHFLQQNSTNRGSIDIRIIMYYESHFGKYDTILDIAYSNNQYLKKFLKTCETGFNHKPYGYKPIYDSYGPNILLVSMFLETLKSNEEFKNFCQEKLNSSSFNKTYNSGGIKDICFSAEVMDEMAVFRKYKNFRIASMLMEDYQMYLNQREMYRRKF